VSRLDLTAIGKMLRADPFLRASGSRLYAHVIDRGTTHEYLSVSWPADVPATPVTGHRSWSRIHVAPSGLSRVNLLDCSERGWRIVDAVRALTVPG